MEHSQDLEIKAQEIFQAMLGTEDVPEDMMEAWRRAQLYNDRLGLPKLAPIVYVTIATTLVQRARPAESGASQGFTGERRPLPPRRPKKERAAAD